MSIDTPERTSDHAPLTPAVRAYIKQGIDQVEKTIRTAEQHRADIDARRVQLDQQRDQLAAELDRERAAADKHLEDLVRSRDQLYALAGADEQGEDDRPTQVCFCGRIATLDPVRGPIHHDNGTDLPAMGACKMPPLGFLTMPESIIRRVTGGKGPTA